MRQRCCIALSSLLIAATALVAPARAQRPVTHVETAERTFTVECAQGFQLVEHYEVTETIRRFDDGGQHTHGRVTAQFTNATTAESLRSTSSFLIVFEPGEQVSFVGVTFRLTAPGHGALAVDAGRLVFDWHSGDVIFERGPSDLRPNLCAVLAG